MILPWHRKQWEQLWQAKLNNRLPHALLLAGLSGLGKKAFADRFSRTLLCEKTEMPNGYCGTCHACRMLANRTHPNVLWIEPEKKGQAIKIDQIRTLAEFTQQSSWQGDYRIVLIHSAEAMNINAANALLKTLEEPLPGVLLILIHDQSSPLLPTILSRCQTIVFSRPEKTEALSWLKQALKKSEKDQPIDENLLLNLVNGAPLKALELIENNFILRRESLLQALYLLHQQQENPLHVAASFEDIDTMCLLDTILIWMLDLMWLQLSVNQDQIVNHDFLKELTILKESTSKQKNMEFIIYLQQVKRQISNGINLNKLLLTENILIRWMQINIKNEITSCF